MKQATSASGGINGWHVLFGMIAFFVAVSAVNGVMIYKAVQTFSGETPDAYRAGLAYNDRIAEERRQEQLGWKEVSKFDDATGKFSIALQDRDGLGVDGLQITAMVSRPATDRADHTITLAAAGSGSYVAVLPDLAEGAWELSLSANRAGDARRDVVYRSKVRLWKQP
jgi:nitrogen fixation protein FixH